MVAFLQAVREGAVMVELDVRLSADKELVVIHDRRMNRTTEDGVASETLPSRS